MALKVLFFVFGGVFGFVLSRSGAADYDYIQKMFLFQDLQLYGILAVAVAVTTPGLALVRRLGRTAGGEAPSLSPKPLHPGNVLGGILFGVGWSITGMCPGPILVNIGEGKLYALAALAGTLVGTYVLGVSYPRLQPLLRLPVQKTGAGDG